MDVSKIEKRLKNGFAYLTKNVDYWVKNVEIWQNG
jgi:hypothetical protein